MKCCVCMYDKKKDKIWNAATIINGFSTCNYHVGVVAANGPDWSEILKAVKIG